MRWAQNGWNDFSHLQQAVHPSFICRMNYPFTRIRTLVSTRNALLSLIRADSGGNTSFVQLFVQKMKADVIMCVHYQRVSIILLLVVFNRSKSLRHVHQLRSFSDGRSARRDVVCQAQLVRSTVECVWAAVKKMPRRRASFSDSLDSTDGMKDFDFLV